MVVCLFPSMLTRSAPKIFHQKPFNGREKCERVKCFMKVFDFKSTFFFRYESRWKCELLQQQIPLLLSSSTNELKFLSSLNFNLKSPLFGVQQREKYCSKVEVEFDKEWKRLEIGECDGSKYSATVFCGGSVAAIDWAPSDSNRNFLAVACNVETKGIKINLETTTRSCVQIHEIKELENEK